MPLKRRPVDSRFVQRDTRPRHASLAESGKHDHICVVEPIAGNRNFLAVPGPSICDNPGGLSVEMHELYGPATRQGLHVEVLCRAHDAQRCDGAAIRSPPDYIYIRRGLELANRGAVL